MKSDDTYYRLFESGDKEAKKCMKEQPLPKEATDELVDKLLDVGIGLRLDAGTMQKDADVLIKAQAEIRKLLQYRQPVQVDDEIYERLVIELIADISMFYDSSKEIDRDRIEDFTREVLQSQSPTISREEIDRLFKYDEKISAFILRNWLKSKGLM